MIADSKGARTAPAMSGAGAGKGNRTLTVSPPADFESAASTSSAIPARGALSTKLSASSKETVSQRAAKFILRGLPGVDLCGGRRNIAVRFFAVNSTSVGAGLPI
jgi:hypothetical protein